MRRALALLALFAALAVLHTWPLGSDIAGLSRLDNDDTGLNVFIIAWVAHIVPRHPLQLFEAPMFYPEPHTLAYSEHMLVPGLLGAPLLWAGASAVTAYNLLAIAGFALSGWTMSLVIRRWTGSTAAGIASGMLFAFNAHLLTRLPHLQALHVEFFPLALWAFDRVITGVQSTGVQGTGVQGTGVQSTGVQSAGVQSAGVHSTAGRAGDPARPARAGSAPPAPSAVPSVSTPSAAPSVSAPSAAPSVSAPSAAPSVSAPSAFPSASAPSAFPSVSAPSAFPSVSAPSAAPSVSAPSAVPSVSTPSAAPSVSAPSAAPSVSAPSAAPSVSAPSAAPSASAPSAAPSASAPSAAPSVSAPSAFPSASAPSAAPSVSAPSAAPSASAPSAALTLASVFVLQALCSNYSLVFLSAALLVGAAVRLPEWLGPRHRSRAAALAGAAALAIVGVSPFLWPYYQVSQAQGLVRSIEEVRLYSAGWLDYLTTGGRLHYDWWSFRFFEGRTALFPGVAGLGLAAVGVASRPILRDRRVRMIAAIGMAGFGLSFGPALPGYEWLQAHVPLLQGIRAAARWGFLFLMAVAMLAGYGVATLERRWRGSVYWPALLVALLGVVTIEALRVPMGFVSAGHVPPIYAELAEEPDAVLVELPLYAGASVSENARYLVAATVHFRALVNGYSGFETEVFRDRATRWRAFPSDAVLDEMRDLGVTHVMVHVRNLGREPVDQAAREPRLALERDDGERRLYRLIR